jgi:heptose I phosphotransferase
MYFFLKPELKKYFKTNLTDCFEQLMTLRGQVYRALEGRCTHRIELDGQGYFLKQHKGVGWKEIFKNLSQGRLAVLSAKNEWLAIRALEQLSIPTLQIAGYGCRGMNPAQLQSFLLTHELTNTVSLEDFCKNWRTHPPLFKIKRALIKEIARMAALLHQQGINHRDFYLCHFLLDQASEPFAPKLYLIDLHRAQIRQTAPARWIIKDLAGLYFSSKEIGLSTRDLYFFIREYRQQALHVLRSKEFIFWNKVKQRGDKMYRK